jgi:hypothetical protein
MKILFSSNLGPMETGHFHPTHELALAGGPTGLLGWLASTTIYEHEVCLWSGVVEISRTYRQSARQTSFKVGFVSFVRRTGKSNTGRLSPMV